MSRIVFVPHAAAAIDSLSPASVWPLSAAGRESAQRLGSALGREVDLAVVGVVSSAEVKAIETAQLLDCGPVVVDARLGEIAKPWYDSASAHGVAAVRYLAGEG